MVRLFFLGLIFISVIFSRNECYGQVQECVVEYLNPGTFNFNVPLNVTSITVETWGGGGRGGNRSIVQVGNSAGGGGGGYSSITINVTPLTIYRVNVGAGSESIQPGGNSWVSPNNTPASAFVLARGGRSVSENGEEGADGGGLGIGSVRYVGGKGANAINSPNGNTSGGGGSSGSSVGNGNNGVGAIGGIIENGGNGADGNDRPNQNNFFGQAGGIPGGGGSGSKRNSNNGTDRLGGKGGNGKVRITYNCPATDPNFPSCATLKDDGALTGEVLIIFNSGICSWIPPEGLAEFDLLVVGGGGGGGMGSMAGGGGGGGLIIENFKNYNNGLGFGPNVSIPIEVGDRGRGASELQFKGNNGSNSSFDMGGFFQRIAGGGGGGGSDNNPEGESGQGNGASGGGSSGYADPGNGINNGNFGGRGDISNSQETINNGGTGGGGGGAGSPGINGNFNSVTGRNGGNGGNGIQNNFSGDPVRYSGGGGGTATIDIPEPRTQGLGAQLSGGNGINPGQGAPGTTPGSGGGAGVNGGGDGFKGLVIVKFQLINILPVHLIYFKGIINNEQRVTKLSWSTSKEWENSHFNIERSIDGTKTFVKIGQVSGMGWTEEVTEYLFEDDKLPLSGGNIYYRLKQVDFNGRFDYSDITTVRVPNIHITKGVWRVYPNPSESNGFNLELVDIGQYHDESISLRILSSHILSTEKVFRNIHELNQTASDFLSTVPKGLWIVEVKWGNRVERIKVMKR